ncbi:hypothetical protein PATA110616_06350 [Paenibacillus tarimensis]
MPLNEKKESLYCMKQGILLAPNDKFTGWAQLLKPPSIEFVRGDEYANMKR